MLMNCEKKAPYPDCMHIRQTRPSPRHRPMTARAARRLSRRYGRDCITDNEPGRSRFLHEQMWRERARFVYIFACFASFRQQKQLLDVVVVVATAATVHATNDTTLHCPRIMSFSGGRADLAWRGRIFERSAAPITFAWWLKLIHF